MSYSLFQTYAVHVTSSQLERIGHKVAQQPQNLVAEELQAALIHSANIAPVEKDQRLMLLNNNGVSFYGVERQDSSFRELPEVSVALTGKATILVRKSAKKRAIVNVAIPVQRQGKVEAVVHLTQEMTSLQEQVSPLQRNLAIFAFAITCIAIILTYGIISNIVRPLMLLSEHAQALAQEEKSRSALNSLDELGVLDTAFNRMQSKLANRVQELQENTEQLAAVLGSMAEGVLAVSPQVLILLANKASQQLLEMNVSNPVGLSLYDVSRSMVLHKAVQDALQSEQPVLQEFEVGSTSRRILSIRATRMPGQPTPGVMVVLHDVTELRRLENLRREFVANVSHELKTPLAAIKAYAETLHMGAIHDSENSLQFVERIQEQAERLHELILDLLQLARVESDQEAFEIVEMDLEEAILDCIDAHLDSAQKKEIRLIVIGTEEPIKIVADEEGVRTIFSNLLSNAIKFTSPQGRVTVKWHREQNLAVIEVSDTGIGIAPKDQLRVFERFYRADKARSRELGGTGLGLSIVKHLAQAFGGTVSLQSQPDVGSTFVVKFPCQTSQN
jgi:two-component system, OmpR family, phosphate regulon sensor histidine kinase PhoR